MTNEAPLPDDVERCLSEMPNVGGFGEEWSGTIRAHIAALEAEIANMKNESAIAYKSGRCDAEAEMGHIVQRLEAENKRLIESIVRSRRFIQGGLIVDTAFAKHIQLEDAAEILDSALAQTGEKP